MKSRKVTQKFERVCATCGWTFGLTDDIVEQIATGKPMHRTCPRDYALMGKTLQLPPCGCTVDGAGTIPNPVRIVFCPAHAATAGALPSDPLERIRIAINEMGTSLAFAVLQELRDRLETHTAASEALRQAGARGRAELRDLLSELIKAARRPEEGLVRL